MASSVNTKSAERRDAERNATQQNCCCVSHGSLHDTMCYCRRAFFFPRAKRRLLQKRNRCGHPPARASDSYFLLTLLYYLPEHFLQRLSIDILKTSPHDVALTPIETLLWPFRSSAPNVNGSKNSNFTSFRTELQHNAHYHRARKSTADGSDNSNEQ